MPWSTLPYPNRWIHARLLVATAYGCTALATVAAGIVGLSGGSWPRQMLESWINVHVLFASLLCGLVTASFLSRVRRSPPMLAADLRALSRHLSRIVYLMLYAVIGLRQAVPVLESLWQGGSVDFGFFDVGFRHGPDDTGFNPKDDFQVFLASGLLVLIVSRLQVFGLWLRTDVVAPTAREPGFHPSRRSQ